jgi:hypothetical protein
MPSSRRYGGHNCYLFSLTHTYTTLALTLLLLPPCILHAGTKGLTTQLSRALRPLSHTHTHTYATPTYIHHPRSL